MRPRIQRMECKMLRACCPNRADWKENSTGAGGDVLTECSHHDGNTALTDHRNLLHYFLFKTSDLGNTPFRCDAQLFGQNCRRDPISAHDRAGPPDARLSALALHLPTPRVTS